KKPAVRVHMDSTGPLPEGGLWIEQCFLHEQRLARKPSRRLSLINVQFVLTLDGDIDPQLGRMKVQMAGAKMHSVPGLNGRKIRQHTAFEVVRLDSARIHRIVTGGIVAARN